MDAVVGNADAIVGGADAVVGGALMNTSSPAAGCDGPGRDKELDWALP